jgi:hypothetical protein
MKKLGSHKWLVVSVAVLLLSLVSLGAVACGSSDNDQVRAGRMATAGKNLQAGAGTGAMGGMMAQRRQAMKNRLEARADRRDALLKNVRDKMSASDQALFDQLTASIGQQRTAAEQARQKLADTLKELRTLVDKYLTSDGSGTD